MGLEQHKLFSLTFSGILSVQIALLEFTKAHLNLNVLESISGIKTE